MAETINRNPFSGTYMVGKDPNNSVGFPNTVELKYFRVCNAIQYLTGRNFRPNFVGIY